MVLRDVYGWEIMSMSLMPKPFVNVTEIAPLRPEANGFVEVTLEIKGRIVHTEVTASEGDRANGQAVIRSLLRALRAKC